MGMPRPIRSGLPRGRSVEASSGGLPRLVIFILSARSPTWLRSGRFTEAHM
jgi:hypothetical protein